jgi:hypothetical protein
VKLRVSRQTIYLLSLSLVLLLVSLLFAFAVLIPAGKEYRLMRLERNKHTQAMMQYQQWHDDTFRLLKELQSKNKNIVTAFKNRFDPDRFVKTNRHFFQSLELAEVDAVTADAPFAVYEVNTTSRIGSPENFYGFLETVNKSDWIIGINFPVRFKRDQDRILSSFTMRVYSTAAKE